MAGSQQVAESMVKKLSVESRIDLAESLEAKLATSVRLPGAELHPPGAQDYRATYVVSWLQEDTKRSRADQQRLLSLAKASNADLDQEVVEVPVGQAHLLVVDLFETQLYDALDSRESDLEYLGGYLFSSGRVDPDLAEEMAIVENHALLVNHVRIDPAWRGLRLGLLGTGLTIRELGRGCSFVALDAVRPGAEGKNERAASHTRLVHYWSKLGFRPWRERILVLDLTLVTFAEAFKELQSAN